MKKKIPPLRVLLIAVLCLTRVAASLNLQVHGKLGEKQKENPDSLKKDGNNPTGLTYLNLDQRRRNKRWKLLQDFFQTNDHGSSLGSEFVGKRSSPNLEYQPQKVGYFLKQMFEVPNDDGSLLFQHVFK